MDATRFMEALAKEFSPLPRGLLGPGASEQIGVNAAGLGLRHVLCVTSSLRGSGVVEDVIGHLESAGVATTLYDKVESNPKDFNCMDAYQAFVEAECDGFVSIGGGSSHDTTKGAKTVFAHDGRNINEFQGNDTTEVRNEQFPVHIAVNTTVGTGSETSNLMVINDTQSPQAPHKWTTTDKNLQATVSINDPIYHATCPPRSSRSRASTPSLTVSSVTYPGTGCGPPNRWRSRRSSWRSRTCARLTRTPTTTKR